MKAFFFGYGYSARAAGRAIHQLVDAKAEIFGTSRSREMADALLAENLQATVFDGGKPGQSVGAALSNATHVIQSIAPDADGDPVLRHHRADLDDDRALEWLCYYSTVGVYGNADGGWIDESAACHPVNLRSQQRLGVEGEWQAYAKARGVPLLILRLAGIYGPGRSTFDKLKANTARRVIKPGQVFNRIHVDDIGRVTALAAQKRLAGIFNLSDDEPAPPQDLVSHAALMLGVEAPPEQGFEVAEMSDMARSFYADNKRVSNKAIKQALGIELLYPNYREGLSAIHAGRQP